MGPFEVLAQYDEGVTAIATSTRDWESRHWHERACGSWSATDLAGHLVGVIGWYHHWLDAAERGSSDPPFPAADLAAQNAKSLRELEDGTGPERVERFVADARRYATRLPDRWDLPYGYPYGTVTAGLHAGVAASEWHLHAWDLTGGKHRPSDPTTLFVAVGSAMTAAQGAVAGRVGRAIVPIAARRKPWDQLLRRSGR
ncbi:MAG: maleylpyruvate isomerase N-terminal domain-containing protein [Acidimicrobiia bacterium]